MNKKSSQCFHCILLAVTILTFTAVACGRQGRVTPTDTPDSLAQEETRAFEELLISAIERRSERDLTGALAELALAESLIEDRSTENSDYLFFLLVKAETYVLFDHLDEAEATLLKATGIPDEYINLIADSRNPLSEEEFQEIAEGIQQLVSQTDSPGYHVALSLIYNILGDTEALEREQQAAMDISDDQDTTLSIGLALYKVRERKIQVHAALSEQQLRVQQKPEDWTEQYRLAATYLYAGWLPEAQEIIDTYPSAPDSQNDQEAYLDFLFLKMNLEMSLGHYEAMQDYEAEILEIDPNALDEFSE